METTFSTYDPVVIIVAIVLLVFVAGGVFAVFSFFVDIIFGFFELVWLFVRHVIWDSIVNKWKTRREKENRFVSKDVDK